MANLEKILFEWSNKRTRNTLAYQESEAALRAARASKPGSVFLSNKCIHNAPLMYYCKKCGDENKGNGGGRTVALYEEKI
jgi:hypothetical protein